MIITPPRIMWLVGTMRSAVKTPAVLIALTPETATALVKRGAMGPCDEKKHPDHTMSAFGIPAFPLMADGREVLLVHVDPQNPDGFVLATDGGTDTWDMDGCTCRMNWLSRSPQYHSPRGCYPLDELAG